MFQPLSLWIGLRYVRARRHRFFVSFITWVSLVGVALGVAALIVVLSVMNGFESETRARLLSLSAHARVLLPGAAEPPAAAALAERLGRLPGVVGAAPYMEMQALAVRQPEMVPVNLRGVEPGAEERVTAIAPLVVSGTVEELTAGSNAVLIGNELAERLAVTVGDKVSIMVPVVTAGGVPEPRLREFTVAGVFNAGISDHDASLVLMNVADARALAPDLRGALGARLRYNDALRSARYLPALRAAAPARAEVHDWSEDNASYLRAVRIEKAMMAVMLLLIVGIAAFSIVAMLVMVVNEKRTDIAILRTLGTSPARVTGVFFTQGLVIGWSGVIAGVLLGLLVAHYAGEIVSFFERLFRAKLFDADVYLISRLPAELHAGQVTAIAVLALAMTLLATLYPARRAARTAPAEALRYE